MTDDKQVKVLMDLISVFCSKSHNVFVTTTPEFKQLKDIGYIEITSPNDYSCAWQITDAGRAALEAHKAEQQEQFRSYRRNEVEAAQDIDTWLARHMFKAGATWGQLPEGEIISNREMIEMAIEEWKTKQMELVVWMFDCGDKWRKRKDYYSSTLTRDEAIAQGIEAWQAKQRKVHNDRR